MKWYVVLLMVACLAVSTGTALSDQVSADVFKARHPVFKAVMLEAQAHTTGVAMAGVLEDQTEALAQFRLTIGDNNRPTEFHHCH